MYQILGRLTKESALVQPQHVTGRQNHANRRKDSPLEIGYGRGLEHQVLANEVVEHGEADTGKHSDHEYGGKPRRRSGNTAVRRNLQRVTSLVQEPDQNEERARRDAVIQHLIDRAIEPVLSEGENPKNDETEVAN